MTSNCVQLRTPIAPQIKIFTLWSSVDGRDMYPHAFQISELNEGDWSSRQFAHTHQVKSAFCSLAENGNSQIWTKLREEERSPYSTQFHSFLWQDFPSCSFRFCIFFSVLKWKTYRDVNSFHQVCFAASRSFLLASILMYRSHLLANIRVQSCLTHDLLRFL